MAIGLLTLWERDGGTCWLCKQPVPHPAGLNSPHELGATRDHVIPKSHGGSNRSHNIRLAHRECNERRGSKHIKGAQFVEPTQGVVVSERVYTRGASPGAGWKFDAIENAWYTTNVKG